MTDSRKNSATALFGLNIDDLAKLASAKIRAYVSTLFRCIVVVEHYAKTVF